MLSARSRLLHSTLGALAFVIGFTQYLQFGPLAQSFVPASPAVAYTGLLLTFAGISLAIWARFLLGGNWSGRVTVKENHTLVGTGPYAVVRHPIYSGMLLAVLGTALALREVRGLVGFGLVLALVLLKARMEESFMIEAFGSKYGEYRGQVKALIPFVY